MIKKDGHDPQHFTITRRGKKPGSSSSSHHSVPASPDYESSYSPSEEEPATIVPWTTNVFLSQSSQPDHSPPRPVTEPDFWSAHSIGREVTVGDIEDEEDDQFKRLRLLVDVAVQQRDT